MRAHSAGEGHRGVNRKQGWEGLNLAAREHRRPRCSSSSRCGEPLQVLNASHPSAAETTWDRIWRVNARTRFKLYQLQFYLNSPPIIAAFVQLFIWLRIKMPLRD